MARRTPSAEVKFADVPPPNRRYNWPVIAEKLRAHPMEWAVIFTRDKTSIVVALRAGHIVTMRPQAGMEYKTRNNLREPEKTCTLYARYNPDLDEE
jgi:hypothetical protein